MRRLLAVCALLTLVVAATGCEDLDGRASNRKANRLFREGRFIDAAALYENALKKVPDDRIHYNLGLAYSRIFRSSEEPVLIAEATQAPCKTLPGVVPTKRSVCVKRNADDEDRSYPDCKKQDDCPTSAECKVDLEMCQITNKQLADMSAEHFKVWISKQDPDDAIAKRDKELSAELTRLEESRDKAEAEAESFRDQATGKFKDKGAYESAMNQKTSFEQKIKDQKEDIEENRLKFTVRTLMTNLFVDSNQHDKALAYWAEELKSRPNDFEAMGKLAGINLKANNWRKAIEWYSIIGEKVPEASNKISAFSSIGFVAHARLRTPPLAAALTPDEAIALADLGIGGMQRALALAPKNIQFNNIQASLYAFRGLYHGVSWAAAIDRATTQDLKALSDVLSGKAKPPADAPKTPETPKSPDPKKPGG